ncbi:hypothetical protein OJAV_G00038210 [Oryzias javanicus]|uniref:Hcy-binding domain-containing protein n=1 Tax=Oryzias javanicus TaxID=123683 RepID=A0A3S2PF73_ORYJA|nr:hypothetical protein OJAV_G00038210 [Oryzias javanicus]
MFINGDPLWSARLLDTNPQAITEADHRFLLSGADVITTATYQASVQGFVTHLGMSAERARELLMSGVHLAREAVKKFGSGNTGPLVAGSIGWYGAYLHDTSEYTGTFAEKMTVEELKDWHRPQVEGLLAAGADLLAFETIPSIKEAKAVDEKHISDGSTFAEAVEVASRSAQLLAVGVNCCSPTVVEPLLDSASSQLSPDTSWVVYPNSGWEYDSEQGWQAGGESSIWIPELSCRWVKQGAALIGGCCCISPAEIAELRKVLKGATTGRP